MDEQKPTISISLLPEGSNRAFVINSAQPSTFARTIE
jgi:hypothetical protein